jgi:protein-S-isoprenylcysteine O-methyltransferase Ste14
MLFRAFLAFLALPGTVAYLIPVLLAPESDPGSGWVWTGNTVLVIGSVLLLACVRDFYKACRGTLAPWSPPQTLVTTGLYRWSRNPMYLSVLVVLLGWSVRYESLWLLGYAAAVGVAFHLRVILYEEPVLRALFGEDWRSFSGRVPRWIGARDWTACSAPGQR